MAIAQKVAGYSLGSADLLRRAMGKKKKEILDREFGPFRDGMLANGYSEDAVGRLWEILVPFSDYAFNKAHTAGYGLLSYWTAYLKANYPAEYMAALLSSVGDDKDKCAVYLHECRRMGIRVLPPDVNESEANFTATGSDIRFGLSAVRNVGHNVVESIIRARQRTGGFSSFVDFLAQVDVVVCNKRVVESLIKAGAFDSLGHPRRGLAQIHGDAVDIAVETKRAQAVGQFDLFGDESGGVGLGMDLVVPDGEWDKSMLLAAEREMLGLYVSDHPLQGIETALNQLTDCSIASLIIDQGADGRVVTIGGLVTEVNRKLTRAGKSWAVVTLEDMAASLEVLMFPKMYEKVAARVVDDAVLLVKGRVEQREDEPNRFVAMEVTVPDLSEGDSGPLTISITASRLVPPVISRLSHILSTHPGASEVRLQVEDGTRTTLLRLDDARRVSVGPSLYADLKALLGPGCLVGSVAS